MFSTNVAIYHHLISQAGWKRCNLFIPSSPSCSSLIPLSLSPSLLWIGRRREEREERGGEGEGSSWLGRHLIHACGVIEKCHPWTCIHIRSRAGYTRGGTYEEQSRVYLWGGGGGGEG